VIVLSNQIALFLQYVGNGLVIMESKGKLWLLLHVYTDCSIIIINTSEEPPILDSVSADNVVTCIAADLR
jgi:hypothetical protein